MTQAAKPTDWKIEGLAPDHATFALDRRFSALDMAQMRLGLIPEQMEDKWFIYWLDNALYFHRSWTGLCMYVVHFAAEGDGSRMIRAEAYREPGQDRDSCDARDAARISYFIDALLLNLPTPFPSEETDPGQRAVANWSAVGRAMLGDHPTRK